MKVTTMEAELEFAIKPDTTGKQLFDQVGSALVHSPMSTKWPPLTDPSFSPTGLGSCVRGMPDYLSISL